MDNIKGIFYAFSKGVIDSLKGVMVLRYLDREMNERYINNTRSPAKLSQKNRDVSIKTPKQFEESKVLRRFAQGCFLNGCIFLLSIILFNYGVLPILRLFLTKLFGEESSTGNFVWRLMEWVLSGIFELCWIIPLFFLIKIINCFWFQDIADSCFRFYRGRPQSMSSLSKLIADSLFSTLVQILFLIQSMAINLIPIIFVAEIGCLIHICLLYSLYAFEYKWFNMGWELHRRLTFIENNWPYFIGFGLPLALSTQLISSIYVSGSIFSIVFPIFIISGNEATPVTGSCDYPLRLFSPVVAISNYVFSHTIGKNKIAQQQAADRR